MVSALLTNIVFFMCLLVKTCLVLIQKYVRSLPVSIFPVFMLERGYKSNPFSALIGSGWTAEKLGNKHGDSVCIEISQ